MAPIVFLSTAYGEGSPLHTEKGKGLSIHMTGLDSLIKRLYFHINLIKASGRPLTIAIGQPLTIATTIATTIEQKNALFACSGRLG